MDIGIEGIDDAVEIGTGGSSIVYRARQTALDRDVAIKVLTIRFGAGDEAERRRFAREQMALGRLSDLPGIVPLYDSGFTRLNQPYLVMPFYESRSLQERLDEHGALQWGEAVRLMAVVGHAVQRAHENGVLHRDIKPANIMIDRQGEPVVGDFGVARLLGSTTMFQSRALLATPAYSPPEVFAGAEASTAVDVYGLGAALFALLRGSPAFMSESGDMNVLALMRRVDDDPVPDLRPAGVPSAVAAVVERSMAKAPSDRYASAARWVAALEAAAAEAAAPAVTTTARQPADPTVPADPAVLGGGALRPPALPPPTVAAGSGSAAAPSIEDGPTAARDAAARGVSPADAAARDIDGDHPEGPPAELSGRVVDTDQEPVPDDPVPPRSEDREATPASVQPSWWQRTWSDHPSAVMTVAAVLLVTGVALSTLGDAPIETADDGTTAEEVTTDGETGTGVAEPGGQVATSVSGCMVTDTAGIDDRSFNQTVLDGLERAREELGASVDVLESSSEADLQPNIEQFLRQDCSLIVTVGFLPDGATQQAAQANPDQRFAIVDVDFYDFDAGEDIEYDNVRELTFAVDQAAFLAGYASAAVTRAGTVATYGGINIPTVTIFMDGFLAGVNHHNQERGADVEVLGWDGSDGLFIGGFESQDDAAGVTRQLIEEGADVIMPVAGPAGLGTVLAVEDANAHGQDAQVVWVDTDGRTAAPDSAPVFLTSVLKRMDVAVFETMQQVATDRFEGGLYVGTLANDGVGIVTDDLGAETLSLLADLRERIVAGDIATRPGG